MLFRSRKSLDKLKEDIKDQIDTYLPEFQGVDVNIRLDEHGFHKKTGDEIIIEINVDDVIYTFETAKLKEHKIGLEDLKI